MSESNTSSEDLIVAIGASAGGLEAFEEFSNTCSRLGLAFAIVQHLAPDVKSALPELLTKYTRMPVEQVRDSTEVLPNRIHVIQGLEREGLREGRVIAFTRAKRYRPIVLLAPVQRYGCFLIR